MRVPAHRSSWGHQRTLPPPSAPLQAPNRAAACPPLPQCGLPSTTSECLARRGADGAWAGLRSWCMRIDAQGAAPPQQPCISVSGDQCEGVCAARGPSVVALFNFG